jgi:hypothetical protein
MHFLLAYSWCIMYTLLMYVRVGFGQDACFEYKCLCVVKISRGGGKVRGRTFFEYKCLLWLK